MSQDILDPKDEHDLAKERQVKPLRGSGGYEPPPPSPPQAVPTMGQAESMAGTPAPPQLPVQQEMSGASGTSPQPQQTPSQMVGDVANDLMFSTPSFQTSGRVAQLSGEEVRLQKDPLEIVEQGIQEQLGQLSPQQMFQGLQRSSYTPQLQTELPDNWEDKQDIVERAIGDVKVKNMNVTQAHQFGYNANNVGRFGVSNAPALDTDLASRGLSSELGKAIEDKLSLDTALSGEGIPVVGNIGGLWRDVSRSVLGIGLGAGAWVESKMPDWYKNKVEAVRKKLGIDDDLERLTRESVEHLRQQTSPSQKFDPTKTSFGDYGSGGTGAALYALNVIPSAVMGGVYDIIDFGRELSGSGELYSGSRTLDAFIKGKDWGLSNQWSDEKYLSLQEPEDLKPGTMTGNPYWDLPEKVAKVTGMNTRAAHWLIQAPLAIAGEALVDIPADRIAAKLGGILPNKVTPAAQLAEEAIENTPGVLAVRPRTDWTRPDEVITPEVLGGEITKYVPTDVKPDEFVRTEVIRPRNAPEQILYVTPNGQVRTTIKDYNGFLRPKLPNGFPSYSDLVNTKPKTVVKPLGNAWSDALAAGDIPPSALSLMRRSDGEMSELARLMPSPLYSNSRPLLPPASRVPSSNELKALELTIPEFKRYGSVTELTPSGFYDDLPPQILPKPSLMLESVEDAMKRRMVEATQAIEAGNGEAFKSAYKAVEQAQIELALVKARHLDSMELYDVLKEKLPSALQTNNADLLDEAQVMLQSDFNITVLGNRKRQVELEISLLNNKIDEIDSQLQIYGDIGRNDLDVSKRTEGWSTEDDFSDELTYDLPERVPGQILTDVTDPQEPQTLDFGDVELDVPNLADDFSNLKPDEVPLGNPTLTEEKPNFTVLGEREDADSYIVGAGMKEKTTVSVKYIASPESYLVEKRWLHGSTSPRDLAGLDYSKGASTSELGFGLYLTTDPRTASKSATRLNTPNQPSNLGQPDKLAYSPTVYEVNPQTLNKVLDLNQPVPRGNFRKMLESAALHSTGDKAFAPHVLDDVNKMAYIWNKFRENYYKYYGKPASEGVVRRYYEYISNSFKNWDIDGGYFSNNGIDTLVVYKGDKALYQEIPFETVSPFSIEKSNIVDYRLAAQQYIDSQVLRQFNDDVSKVNWLSSNRDLAEWLKRKHQKSLAEIQADLMDEIELNMDAEEALRYGVEDEVFKTIESFKENLDTRTVQEFNIDTKKISESPCPPMTSNFFKVS